MIAVAMLIVAMILAAAVTHAVENSGRQAAARWQESREQAKRRGAERVESRRVRTEQVKDRFNSARSTGPKDPLWWPYAAGYGLAGAAAAAGAGAVGLAQGARAGAKSGYRVGQEGARRGWNLRDTWAAWRSQNPRRPIELQQCERCGGWVPELHTTMDHGLVCDDCLPVDVRDSDDPTPEPEADSHTTSGTCGSCGRTCPPFERDVDGWCRGCVDAAHDVQNGHGASPCARCGRPVGHRGVGAGSTPDRIVCPPCGSVEMDERLRDLGADNSHEPPGEGTPPTIRATAERIYPDPEPGTPQPKENSTMNALPTGSSVAVTGEGYTDTIQSLQTVAKEAQEAYQAVTDLGDALNASSLDAETLQQIADLTDQLENASTTAENLARHVEQRHNPLAEATAAAGGSQNVASKSWYDQY